MSILYKPVSCQPIACHQKQNSFEELLLLKDTVLQKKRRRNTFYTKNRNLILCTNSGKSVCHEKQNRVKDILNKKSKYFLCNNRSWSIFWRLRTLPSPGMSPKVQLTEKIENEKKDTKSYVIAKCKYIEAMWLGDKVKRRQAVESCLVAARGSNYSWSI